MKLKENPVILAIESSCDDTSAAVFESGKMLSNLIATQAIHEQYGGVVPEVASRAHQEHILPVVDTALKKAGKKLNDIDCVAVTAGPGLMGSLLVGVTFAKSLALCLDVPLIDVHHMEAHVLAHFIDDPQPKFPFLNLTVSGGHTQIVLVKDFFDMKVVGTTIDDAAGEAFDKSGKILGLGYPAGPLIDKHAALGVAKFSFPEPQIANLDFSFSGLKTSILYFLKEQQLANKDFINENLDDICASVQSRIISILIKKLTRAVRQYKVDEIGISGGVSANSGLRKAIMETGEKLNLRVHIPKFEYCTDNAAMIAMAAYYKYKAGLFADQALVPFTRS
ncbi:MAG TPA: tRNA (adenosine(37)-N6)-threonylcarbamoyltransferase complex transferase subunit TsaD [Saprospiraceae bacterium]|nr:tRNA (adenosine(37)-N6)-threonylcarbamoyltransferase complex transferase subunit TsaD [Saprospiraceae bacterium]MCC6688347.1 tRNA (adenosine(37)-N6)-threonylcarbamoyltransferase complex transferase subunit TsaD [Saprospiraceae bacterium]HMV24224.1 tRNA (adenosine(37)-N6)-threonylcarbamoyltransferase complex transferase subunit TsaD [Saprospiraceae bacterium]HMW75093.1 tRNA (adenosine(37)-N6)-threonylcarbamoyltransferase complex transferase subunit TsaD [Saprospiraceae bacterium]HMX83730.1 tR